MATQETNTSDKAKPKQATNAGKLIYYIGVIVVIGLIIVGVLLMVRSHDIYNKSYEQSNIMAAKMLDTTFKKQVTLVTPNYTSIKDGYGQALSFFILALSVLIFLALLPRLQNFSIGPAGINVTLKDLQQNVETLIRQTNTMQAESTGEGGKPKAVTRADFVQKEAKVILNEEFPDDPQKTKWGGKPERNFRKLDATVTNSKFPGYYQVTLTVESTNKKFPLEGLVKFHLHNTFKNPDPVISVENGIAVLHLTKVYGAFTVGAETDNGATKLELDLAQLEGAPKEFLEN